MSLYNISTSETRNNNAIGDWNTNINNKIINFNDLYTPPSQNQTTNYYRYVLNPENEPINKSVDRFPHQGVIDSSSLPNFSNNNNLGDKFANFTGSYFDKLILAIYWKPINN